MNFTADKYRYLDEGEIVWPGDECEVSRDSMKDPPLWKPVSASMIGKPASNRKYPAHMTFRRLKSVEAAMEYPVLESGSEAFSG